MQSLSDLREILLFMFPAFRDIVISEAKPSNSLYRIEFISVYSSYTLDFLSGQRLIDIVNILYRSGVSPLTHYVDLRPSIEEFLERRELIRNQDRPICLNRCQEKVNTVMAILKFHDPQRFLQFGSSYNAYTPDALVDLIKPGLTDIQRMNEVMFIGRDCGKTSKNYYMLSFTRTLIDDRNMWEMDSLSVITPFETDKINTNANRALKFGIDYAIEQKWFEADLVSRIRVAITTKRAGCIPAPLVNRMVLDEDGWSAFPEAVRNRIVNFDYF